MTYEGLPVVIRKQTNPVISWGHSGIAFEHAGIVSGVTKATAKSCFGDRIFRECFVQFGNAEDNQKVIPACVF